MKLELREYCGFYVDDVYRRCNVTCSRTNAEVEVIADDLKTFAGFTKLSRIPRPLHNHIVRSSFKTKRGTLTRVREPPGISSINHSVSIVYERGVCPCDGVKGMYRWAADERCIITLTLFLRSFHEFLYTGCDVRVVSALLLPNSCEIWHAHENTNKEALFI